MWPLKNRRATHSKCTYSTIWKTLLNFTTLTTDWASTSASNQTWGKTLCWTRSVYKTIDMLLLGFFVTDLSVLPKYQITKIWCCSAYFSHVFTRTIVDYHPIWVLGANWNSLASSRKWFWKVSLDFKWQTLTLKDFMSHLSNHSLLFFVKYNHL